MGLYETPATIERVYCTVPEHYGIGHDFGMDLVAAVAAARATITRFDYPGQTPDHTFSRAWVDLRGVIKLADGTTRDVLLGRTEIFLNSDGVI